MFSTTLKTLAVAAGALALTAPAAAVTTTYAQFNQQSQQKLLSYHAGPTTTILAAVIPVDLTILAFGPLGTYSDAKLTVTAMSDLAVQLVPNPLNTVALQPGFHGTLSLIGTDGVNYLTVAFANAVFSSFLGSGSGALTASEPCCVVSVSSDVMALNNFGLNNFALSFSGFSRPYALGRSFVANVSGTFAGEVPEPATWALMIAGFGMVGFAARRRRSRAVLA